MTATEHIDPTKAVGRLLTAGWRVERTFAYDGGTWLLGKRDATSLPPQFGPNLPVEHGELVEVVIEDTPADEWWVAPQACWDSDCDDPAWPCEHVRTMSKAEADAQGVVPLPDDAPLYGVTIQQPYASLIAHGVKTIETRGYRPRVVKPGDDIAIIAGAKVPKDGMRFGPWSVYRSGSGLSYLQAPAGRTIYGAVGLTELRLPLGAVVAVARFVEALPIELVMPKADRAPGDRLCDRYRGDRISVHPVSSTPTMYLHRDGNGHDIEDQRPYGIYEPGRFGWLLDNVRRLPEPIPCTGFQGLRALPDDVTGDVRQAVQ